MEIYTDLSTLCEFVHVPRDDLPSMQKLKSHINLQLIPSLTCLSQLKVKGPFKGPQAECLIGDGVYSPKSIRILQEGLMQMPSSQCNIAWGYTCYCYMPSSRVLMHNYILHSHCYILQHLMKMFYSCYTYVVPSHNNCLFCNLIGEH